MSGLRNGDVKNGMEDAGSETRRSPIMRVHWFLLDIFSVGYSAVAAGDLGQRQQELVIS